MSQTYIAQVFVSDTKVSPEDVVSTIADVISSSLRGCAWYAGNANVNALLRFEYHYDASSYQGSGPTSDRISSSIRSALRRLTGRGAKITVHCGEIDEMMKAKA